MSVVIGFLAWISGFVAAIIPGNPRQRNAVALAVAMCAAISPDKAASGSSEGHADDHGSGYVMSRISLAAIVLAALVSAVPSKAALFPTRVAIDLSEDDLTGSGLEPDGGARSAASAEREESLEVKVVRQWREMAKRARRQAELLGGAQRKVLLERAVEYELRAQRIEDGEAKRG